MKVASSQFLPTPFAGAYAAPAPRESAGRFTPIGKMKKVLRKIFHESHSLARCSKWAHLHFSSACVRVQTRVGSLFPALCKDARLFVPLVPCSLRSASEGALGLFRPFCPFRASLLT